MPSSLRFFARNATRLATGLAAGALAAVFGGCVFYVDDTQCGPFAYDYRGACFCEDGYQGDPYTAGCSPVMTWRVTDDCDDGVDVGWKLFANDRDWTWPSGDAIYVTPGFGFDGLEAIVCEPEELICFGAEAASGLVYGVGLDFGESCNDCCFPCRSQELDIGYLTCN